MTQPPGFPCASHLHHVCLLKKAIYGLKTASTITILLVYVDDILVTGSNSSHIDSLIAHMHIVFAMKELGNISYFLGVSNKACGDSYFLSQHKYASDILLKAGMANYKPCSFPISVKPSLSLSLSLSLSPDSHLPFGQPELYRSIVGALQYLTITRPDLSLSINQACQHMHTPTVGHFASVKRLLRFVQGTLTHGLTFSPSSFDLQAFSDSNWAGDVLDRRSTSSYRVYLGLNLSSWSTKKQPTVSRFSIEAEYRSLAHTTAELTWLQMLLSKFHLPFSIALILWCDNLLAISLASNPMFHIRSKHIEVDCHFIRKKIADIFTKPLSVSRFQYLQAKLLVSPSPISLQEGDKTTTAVSGSASALGSAATAPTPAIHSPSVTSRSLYSQLGIG
ncbi:uncharacterized protein LOC114261559 [Camellia sinensis]|uniref:uncharacterized protein LOC114261559 n=1 Tax=Camellia sinensis TaxID=4442 RepID=UPI001035E2A9|nr:uncharacterized protein LOC114261559 [Camellia sinensis]